jgi:3-methyladenine DNA glycosylase Tag
MKKNVKRRSWMSDDPLMIAHHDTEWGMPLDFAPSSHSSPE